MLEPRSTSPAQGFLKALRDELFGMRCVTLCTQLQDDEDAETALVSASRRQEGTHARELRTQRQ